MGLLNRIKLTLRADAHGAIDALQEPALLLKQHLREADAAVQDKRSALTRLQDEQGRLATSRDRVATEEARHEEDVTLAVDEGKDDLARQAIARVLSLRQLRTRLAERVSEVAAEQAALSSTLETQEAELEVLRTRVRSHLEQLEHSRDEPGAHGPSLEAEVYRASPTPDQVEMELLRRKRDHGTSDRVPPAAPTEERL